MSGSRLGENNGISNVMMLGYTYLFSRIIISAMYNISVKHFKNTGISAIDIAFYSSIFGIIFLLIVFPFKEKMFGKQDIKSAGFWPLMFASLFGVALYVLFYNMATAKLQVGRVAVTYYIYPVFFYVIGSILVDKDTKKAFNPKILTGIFICVLGVFFTNYNEIVVQRVSDYSGYIYVLLSVFCMVTFSVIAKKYKIPTYWFLLIGQFISLGIAFFNYVGSSHGGHLKIPVPSFTQISILILFGILANVMREFMRIKSIEYLPISQISTWNYFSPLITGLSGILFLHETFTVYDAIGYSLVIGGNVIANFKLKSAKTQ